MRLLNIQAHYALGPVYFANALDSQWQKWMAHLRLLKCGKTHLRSLPKNIKKTAAKSARRKSQFELKHIDTGFLNNLRLQSIQARYALVPTTGDMRKKWDRVFCLQLNDECARFNRKI